MHRLREHLVLLLGDLIVCVVVSFECCLAIFVLDFQDNVLGVVLELKTKGEFGALILY